MNGNPPGTSRHRRDIGLAALVFAATLALFWPAVHFDFVGLDDEPYVSENPMTRNGISAEALKWAATAKVVGNWAPVLWVSYMLDGTVFGPGPAGFHFTNILLHALNAALVFVLLRRWTGARGAALWGALFWSWHPLRVESVAWITERKDVLSGLFFLLCAGAYVRGARTGGGWCARIGLPAGLLGLGLMVKPVLVTVPFVLLLLDAWPLGRMGSTVREAWRALPRLVREKWLFWLLAGSLGAASWHANAVSGIPHAGMPALADRLLLIPGNYLVYLRQTVWPGLLAALYPRPQFSAQTCGVALAVLGGLAAAVARTRRAQPGAGIGYLWFLGMLVPSIGLVWMGTTEGAGDRFTYLPAVGLSLMAATWASALPRGKRFQAVVGAAILAATAAGTARQLAVWKNSGALFARVLAVDPNQFQAVINEGLWQWEQGRETEAKPYFAKAWALTAANRPEILGDAAYAGVLQGRARQAQAMLAFARRDPRATPRIHGAYGMACLHLGEASSAARHLERALELAPTDPEFRVELIRAHFEAGEEEKARQQAAKLKGWSGPEIKTEADLFPFYVQRWRTGAREYAWKYFARLAAMEPKSVPLLNNLAWLMAADAGAVPEHAAAAVALANQAIATADAPVATLLDTLALAQAAGGDFAGAAGTAEKAVAQAEKEGDSALKRDIQIRLQAYQAGKRPRL